MDHPGEAQSASPRERREAARKMAAYHTARVWGLWLFLTAGCFALLYWGLSIRREKSWTVQIRAALDRGDDPLAALLLHRCRAEAPDLASSPAMLALKSELLRRQENRVRQEEAFNVALAALRRTLDDGSWQKRVMALEFAEVARLAPDEAALNRLRKLELHYEALLQLRDSEIGLAAARRLGALRKDATALRKLRQAGDWERHAEELRRCQALLTELREPAAEFPELLPACRELENALRTEEEAGRERISRERGAKEALRTLAEGVSPEELAARCRNFLTRYPDAAAAPAVRRLEADLAWLSLPWRDMVEEGFSEMREKELRALAMCREILRQTADDPALPGDARAAVRASASEAGRLAPEELTDFLERLEQEPDHAAGAAARKALREKLDPVWSLLHSVCPDGTTDRRNCAARFRLLREFREECLNNLPKYAGVWCNQGGAEAFFSPAAGLREHGEAWLPGQERKLDFLGEMHETRLFPRSPAPTGFRLVLAPSGSLRSAAKRERWKLRAAELGLPKLPWPAFWPEERR